MRFKLALALIATLAASLVALPDTAVAGETFRDSLSQRRATPGELLVPLRPALPKAASPASSATSAACAVFPGDGADDTGPLGAWGGPALSYTDHGDGTVTDDNTGLMWEVKVAGGGGSATCLTEPHAVESRCDWYDATGAWIDGLNGTGYAGYSDWRLPNVKELQSIVDYGEFNPVIDPSFPGETASSIYWSATSDASDPSGAWVVTFFNGVVADSSETNLFRVRAVRGGP